LGFPSGAISFPLIFNCSISGLGICGHAAVIAILSYGDSDGYPFPPSPRITMMSLYPSFSRFLFAN